MQAPRNGREHAGIVQGRRDPLKLQAIARGVDRVRNVDGEDQGRVHGLERRGLGSNGRPAQHQRVRPAISPVKPKALERSL
jgi:hypothetical protein